MFKLNESYLHKTPYCSKPVDEKEIRFNNYQHFDKDGFELTPLERMYYAEMGFHRHFTDCLYHTCWQQDWFKQVEHINLNLDHSLVLHRCSYIDEAEDQLKHFVKSQPKLILFLNSKAKWGLDFALDYYDEKGCTEVMHIENDYREFDEFMEDKVRLEKLVFDTDWVDVYKTLDRRRDEWEHLIGYDQNDWKSTLIGFNKAEITHKAV